MLKNENYPTSNYWIDLRESFLCDLAVKFHCPSRVQYSSIQRTSCRKYSTAKETPAPQKIEKTDSLSNGLELARRTHLIDTTRGEKKSIRSALHVLDDCTAVYIVDFVCDFPFSLVLDMAAAESCKLCYFGCSCGQAFDRRNSSTNRNASLATYLECLEVCLMHSSC